jgi:hypothetical protein
MRPATDRQREEDMRTKHFIVALAAVSALGVGVAGCSHNHDGTYNQAWTIGGSTDPAVCSRVNANQLRIVVFDPNLFIQATHFAACTDFNTSVVLAENNYTASLTFLDPAGVPVSNTRAITQFSVTEDGFTNLNIDFPLTEFFPR